jgi:hypothetical protein
MIVVACILGVCGWLLGGAHMAASFVCWGIFLRTTVE